MSSLNPEAGVTNSLATPAWLTPYGQVQLLFRIFLSVIEHLSEPGGDCSDAVPLNELLTTLAVTRRPSALLFNVMMQPWRETTPVPV